MCHTSDSNLQYSDPESMGRVATPGGDLLYDLLTPCVGTLKSIAFTIYELQLIQPAGFTICRWFLVGRDMTSLKTITCEARPFLKRYVNTTKLYEQFLISQLIFTFQEVFLVFIKHSGGWRAPRGNWVFLCIFKIV